MRDVAQGGSVAESDGAAPVGEDPVALPARRARQAGGLFARLQSPGQVAGRGGIAEGADVPVVPEDPVALAGRRRFDVNRPGGSPDSAGGRERRSTTEGMDRAVRLEDPVARRGEGEVGPAVPRRRVGRRGESGRARGLARRRRRRAGCLRPRAVRGEQPHRRVGRFADPSHGHGRDVEVVAGVREQASQGDRRPRDRHDDPAELGVVDAHRVSGDRVAVAVGGLVPADRGRPVGPGHDREASRRVGDGQAVPLRQHHDGGATRAQPDAGEAHVGVDVEDCRRRPHRPATS